MINLISIKKSFLKVFFCVICLGSSYSSQAETSLEVQKKTEAAVDSAVTYSKEQKEAFQKDMKARLTEVKNEISLLQQKAKETTGEAKSEIQQKIKTLKSQQKQLNSDYQKLKKSSGQAWVKIKEGMTSALDQLKRSFSDAKSEFDKKETK